MTGRRRTTGVAAGRFAGVGLAATLLHVVVAALLITGAGLHPAPANGAAFLVANGFSYLANTGWTFGATPDLGNWSRFVSVSLLAWLLTMALTGAVAELGGHYLLGIALVIVVVPVLSFLAHRRWTYR